MPRSGEGTKAGLSRRGQALDSERMAAHIPCALLRGGAALWPLGAGVCQSAGAEGSRIMWVPALGSLDADTGRVTSTMWLNKVNLLVAEKEAHRQIGCLEGIIIYQSK